MTYVPEHHPTFVYQPGGTAEGVLFTDWGLLMAAVAKLDGPKWVEIDGSIAPAHATVGAWNINDITFSSAGATPSASTQLIWDSGATASFTQFTLRGAVWFVCDSTSVVATPGANALILMRDVAQITANASRAAWLQVSSTPVKMLIVDSATIGGAHPVATVDAGKNLTIFVFTDCSIAANTIVGAGTCTVAQDCSSFVGAQTVSTLTIVTISVAQQVAYTAAVPANWAVNPSQVAQALDELAALLKLPAAGADGTVLTSIAGVWTPEKPIGPTFVFRPGGTAAGNVYTVWSTMMADVATVSGPKWVEIDGSVANPHCPAGTWNVDDVHFTARGSVGSAANALIFDDGSHLTYRHISLEQGVKFNVTAPTTPVVTFSAASVTELHDQSAIFALSGGGGGGFAQCNATVAVALFNNSGIGNVGGGTVFTVAAGNVLVLTAIERALVSDNVIAGAGTLAISYSADASLGLTQTITTVSATRASIAPQVGYSPATPANWATPPVQVAQALDELAALPQLPPPGSVGTVVTSTGSAWTAQALPADTDYYQTVEANGSPVSPQRSAVDFEAGTGISVSGADVGGVTKITVTNTAPYPGDTDVYQQVEANGGAPVPQEGILNFINGSNISVTAVDNPGAGRTDVTITNTAPEATDYYQQVEANGGGAVVQRPITNFINGSNISVTAVDNPGQNRTDVTVTNTAPETTDYYQTVEVNGSAQSQQPIIDFEAGTGVVLTPSTVGSATTVTIAVPIAQGGYAMLVNTSLASNMAPSAGVNQLALWSGGGPAHRNAHRSGQTLVIDLSGYVWEFRLDIAVGTDVADNIVFGFRVNGSAVTATDYFIDGGSQAGGTDNVYRAVTSLWLEGMTNGDVVDAYCSLPSGGSQLWYTGYMSVKIIGT